MVHYYGKKFRTTVVESLIFIAFAPLFSPRTVLSLTHIVNITSKRTYSIYPNIIYFCFSDQVLKWQQHLQFPQMSWCKPDPTSSVDILFIFWAALTHLFYDTLFQEMLTVLYK